MKTILSVTCFFFAIYLSFAQASFEGTIKWSIKMTPTGSSTAAPVELTDKQKEELKESIAQIESQLNDPQMQAMLDSNPSMKVTLMRQLQTMKEMQGDVVVNNLLPRSFTIKMKDGNSLTTVEGITSSMIDVLYQKVTDKTFYIKRDAKTYSVASKHTKTAEDSSIVTVAATAETKKILSYNCIKYIVTLSNKGEKQTMNVWATKDLKQFDVKSFHNSNIGGNNSFSEAFKKIDGISLAMEMSEQGQTIKMEVIELKSGVLPAADFTVPADFKEVPLGQ